MITSRLTARMLQLFMVNNYNISMEGVLTGYILNLKLIIIKKMSTLSFTKMI